MNNTKTEPVFMLPVRDLLQLLETEGKGWNEIQKKAGLAILTLDHID